MSDTESGLPELPAWDREGFCDPGMEDMIQTHPVAFLVAIELLELAEKAINANEGRMRLVDIDAPIESKDHIRQAITWLADAIPGWEICETCKGDGWGPPIDMAQSSLCPTCGGRGHYLRPKQEVAIVEATT